MGHAESGAIRGGIMRRRFSALLFLRMRLRFVFSEAVLCYSNRSKTMRDVDQIITVLAWRRPAYLARCLEALRACRGIKEWHVAISVDGLHPDPARSNLDSDIALTYRVAKRESLRFPYWPPYWNGARHCGVAEHPKDRISHMVDARGYRYVLALEDDCLLTPDALELATWFRNSPVRDDYAFMSLARETQEADPTRAGELLITDDITSPWAWCFTAESWKQMAPRWNSKEAEPTGWDWSLRYELARANRWALTPFLPRAYNIGAEGGVHETQEHFDACLKDATRSDGAPANFFVGDTLRIHSVGESRIAPWMQAENKGRGFA